MNSVDKTILIAKGAPIGNQNASGPHSVEHYHDVEHQSYKATYSRKGDDSIEHNYNYSSQSQGRPHSVTIGAAGWPNFSSLSFGNQKAAHDFLRSRGVSNPVDLENSRAPTRVNFNQNWDAH